MFEKENIFVGLLFTENLFLQFCFCFVSVRIAVREYALKRFLILECTFISQRFHSFPKLKFNFFLGSVVNVNLIFNIDTINNPTSEHTEFNKIVNTIFSIHFL